MKQRTLTILILISFILMGCVPASESGNEPGAPEFKLPIRPATDGPIISRELLFKNDQRVSYCELIENQASTYSGIRDTQLEPLASLSKVVTSAWAIGALGPDFRFENEWYLNPVPGRPGIFDAHLSTNHDPIVNTEKVLFFLSELKALGVSGLRQLTIDETTRVYLSVLSQPHLQLSEVPVPVSESKENLKLILNSARWGPRTLKARDNLINWAQLNKRPLNIPNSFSVEDVVVIPASQVMKANYQIKKVIKSAPLFKYLKNMNVFSNNYLADALFSKLGGLQHFRVFQNDVLRMPYADLKFYSGSGLSTVVNGRRLDNLGTCFSLIKVLSFFRQVTQKAQLNLGQILLNPTTDHQGTFHARTNYSNSVVLKTGRLYDNPALNLAGFVSTRRGLLSFVFLGHDFTEQEAREMEHKRTEILDHIFEKYATAAQFSTLPEYEIFL